MFAAEQAWLALTMQEDDETTGVSLKTLDSAFPQSHGSRGTVLACQRP